jgi:hypothetical protein
VAKNSVFRGLASGHDRGGQVSGIGEMRRVVDAGLVAKLV